MTCTDPANYLRLDVLGLIRRIRSTATPPFPLIRPQFRVLVVLTECRGAGELWLRVVQADTGHVVFRNQPRNIRFSGAPEDAVGITFRIQNCSFPAAGLYWVECIFSGTVIARQRLSVTA
jgi:hypothetical protein